MGDGAVETGPAGKALVEELYTWGQLPDLTEGHQGVRASPAEAHGYRADVGKTGETTGLAGVVSLVGGAEHGRSAVGSFRLPNHILKHSLGKK